MKIERKENRPGASWEMVSLKKAISSLEGGGYWKKGTAKKMLSQGNQLWTSFYFYRKAQENSGLEGTNDLQDRLRRVIENVLNDCDPAITPKVCQTISSPEGREKLSNLILNIMARDGITASAALAQIDSDIL